MVFADLSLDVERGEMLALIGESGCGKSTLLHLLGGLDRPSRGTIHYQDREISGLANSELADFRNREIGFVWQTHYLLPEFTALENVMMPLLIRGGPAVLLADEPTGNLDMRTGETIFQLLQNLHRSHRLTSVIVTHNPYFARRCGRVLNLQRESLVPDGGASWGGAAGGVAPGSAAGGAEAGSRENSHPRHGGEYL